MRVLITTEQIQKRVTEMACVIESDFRGRPLTIVGVLTGSLMFVADLVRRLDVPLRIGLIQASIRVAVLMSGSRHLRGCRRKQYLARYALIEACVGEVLDDQEGAD